MSDKEEKCSKTTDPQKTKKTKQKLMEFMSDKLLPSQEQEATCLSI